MRKLRSVAAVLVLALVLSACAYLPSFSGECYSRHSEECTELSQDWMSQIVEALNTHDAAALTGLFSANARGAYSTEIDDGLAYLLSIFPDGDVVWLDQDAEPGVGPWSYDGGRHAVWMSSSYRVTSGGIEYELFFSGYASSGIDPDDVGVAYMGAVPQSDSGHSNLDAALRSWRLSRFDDHRAGVFVTDDGELSHDRASRIVDAVNTQNAAVLREMFTQVALAEYAAEIDNGIQHLLSQFPSGDLALQAEPAGVSIAERVCGDARAVLRSSFYRVSSEGVEYRLYFAEFTENTTDFGGVGIHAIGAAPLAPRLDETPEAGLYSFTHTIAVGVLRPPGIYIADEEYAGVADAVC
jgi:hypothetical protein